MDQPHAGIGSTGKNHYRKYEGGFIVFNTVCWYLNVIGLSFVAAWLRRCALHLLAARAHRWEYGAAPCAGYRGGVDVPFLGTVAFIPWADGNPDAPYVFEW